MGNWERIQLALDGQGSDGASDIKAWSLPVEYDCYYQDDTLRWVQNMKCTPWQASEGGKSIVARETEAYNTYTAFELTYNAYLRTAGSIEFKYRKDSKRTYIVNGEFKFAVNNKEVLLDYKVAKQSDWEVFKYALPQPGMYTFTWIYTKYSEKTLTESMGAELEYVKISGLDYNPKQCIKCE